MKTKPFSTLLVMGLSLLSATATAENLVRQSKESLAAKSARITQGQAESSNVRITSNSTPSARNPLRRSSILSFNGKCTIVPAGSVINLPTRFADRVVSKPEGKLVSFPEFLRANFGWLQTKEITKKELEGANPSEKSAQSTAAKSTYVVIATRNKSPISAQVSAK